MDIKFDQLDRRLRGAFTKVKEDILALRRTANKQLYEVNELKGMLDGTARKDEFYNFIKQATERLEHLESTTATAKSVEDSKMDIAGGLNGMAIAMTQLKSQVELLENTKLKKELEQLEERLVRKKELENELNHLKKEMEGLTAKFPQHSELDVLKRNLGEEIKALRSSYSEFRQVASGLAKLEEKAATRKELAKELEGITEQLSEIDSYLEELTESEELDVVTKQDLNNTIKDMHDQYKDIRAVREHTERIRSFEQEIRRIDSLTAQVAILAKQLKGMERTADTSSNLESLREDTEYLKANMAASQDISRLTSEFDDTVKALREDASLQSHAYESRLNDLEKELHALKEKKSVHEEPKCDNANWILPIILLIIIGTAAIFITYQLNHIVPVSPANQANITAANYSTNYSYIPIDNITGNNSYPTQPVINFTNASTVPAANFTGESNATTNLSFITEKNRECIDLYECKESEGQNWFACYYEQSTGSCKCYLGAKEKCRQDLVPFRNTEPKKELATIGLYKNYILAGVLALALSILLLELLHRNSKQRKKPVMRQLKDFLIKVLFEEK